MVSPAFFGYEKDIVAELERQGFATTFVDERPSNSAVIRAVLRVRRALVGRRVDRHYRETLDRIRDVPFDLVLVIKAEVVPEWFLREVRRLNPSARLVFYAFDAIANSPNCLGLLDLFDARVSFDRADVETYEDFEYLPLFYTPEYHPRADEDAGSRRYDLAFVGTLHSDRYGFVKRLFGENDRNYAFFYVQARWYFAITKYLTRESRRVPWREVSFTPLTRVEIAEIFRESNAVLDMQRPGQTGLTMRTLEVLASGSVLVTTNPAIERESFYDPSRIIVVPESGRGMSPNELLTRVTASDVPRMAPEGFETYSLESFVRQLIEASGAA